MKPFHQGMPEGLAEPMPEGMGNCLSPFSFHLSPSLGYVPTQLTSGLWFIAELTKTKNVGKLTRETATLGLGGFR